MREVDMDSRLGAVIARIPAWRDAADLTAQAQPGGKTNTNFRVTVGGQRFVVRIAGDNAALLGINRVAEQAALRAASADGVAPEVAAYLMPEGHLITRWIDGREWSQEEFRQPEIIARVAETLTRVHALPPIGGVFDPARDIYERIRVVQAQSGWLPPHLDAFLGKLTAVQESRAAALGGSLSLCHNDPWHNNFLDDGAVRLLDWEFAGMGDPFFDLASVAAPFSPDEKTLFLERYFGRATDAQRQSLEDMIFVVVLWNATWALIQTGTGRDDHDYESMARGMFDFLEPRL